MNKIRLYIATASLCGLAGYLAYQLYFPAMVAKGISNEYNFLIPPRFHDNIEEFSEPLNDGALKTVEAMHKSGLSIDEVLKAIDEASEDQALALLDELNRTDIKDADHFFNLVKKHFPVSFDAEIFRKPFTDKVTVQNIKKGIRYANIYKERGEIDAETVKSIAKRILIQKEAEFNQIVEN